MSPQAYEVIKIPLRAIGEALYGPQWQSPMANDLGVNSRTVRRWITGENRPPPSILLSLQNVMERRRNLLNNLIDSLTHSG